MVWLKIIFFIFFTSFTLFADELSEEEIQYFNFLDLNNDDFISLDEIDQSVNLIFQLIDIDKNGKISKNEISELKKVIYFFKWVFGEKF